MLRGDADALLSASRTHQAATLDVPGVAVDAWAEHSLDNTDQIRLQHRPTLSRSFNELRGAPVQFEDMLAALSLSLRVNACAALSARSSFELDKTKRGASRVSIPLSGLNCVGYSCLVAALRSEGSRFTKRV